MDQCRIGAKESWRFRADLPEGGEGPSEAAGPPGCAAGRLREPARAARTEGTLSGLDNGLLSRRLEAKAQGQNSEVSSEASLLPCLARGRSLAASSQGVPLLTGIPGVSVCPDFFS